MRGEIWATAMVPARPMVKISMPAVTTSSSNSGFAAARPADIHAAKSCSDPDAAHTATINMVSRPRKAKSARVRLMSLFGVRPGWMSDHSIT